MRKKTIARAAIALCFFSLQACNNSSSGSEAADSTTVKKDPVEEKQAADTVLVAAPADSTKAVNATPPPKTDDAKPEAEKPGKKDNAKLTAEKTVATPPVDHASIDAGKNLLSTSDCLACHKIQEKAIGPAYIDIAKKYPSSEANIQLLANKVIAGGSGVWGPIPMAPHPSLQADDVKKMVTYILSLD